MTKTPLPLNVADISTFSRALANQLGKASPSHLKLMNMIARAAGFQNMQHMRTTSAAAKRLNAQSETMMADARTVERTLQQFDDYGRLVQWPSKRAVQTLALWALWARLPSNGPHDEKSINQALADEHLFNDPATLRRTMISCGLITRNPDGSNYRRIDQKPPEEAKAVISEISTRRRNRVAHP